MRILAIRGRNLTALAGDFAVDFEADPLNTAGLFAITGPTGAGKSTLLDALCVALYDRFPRLENAARAAVGQPDADAALLVKGTDPRTILRHGEGRGFAEVDFQGRDGGRYRARWEVRRARERAGGALQKTEMRLTCLATGRDLGGTKTETLAAIADKTGLTFDQFRRSVLLAQGDFDAFLKAKDSERADLLELMTGTAIYGELSVAAYGRWKTEREKLDALDARLQALAVMTEEDRAAAESAAAEAEAEARETAAALEDIKAQQAWYREADRLAEAVAAAEAEAARAAEVRAAAAGERARADRLRHLHRLRPVVAEADRLAAEAGRLAADHDEAEARRTGAAAEAERAASRHAEAAAALERAETALTAAAPALEKAADLDSRLQSAAAHAERCRTARREAEDRARAAEAALAALRSERAAADRRVSDADDWLTANTGRRLLAEQVDRWADIVEDWAEAFATRETATARIASVTERLSDIEKKREKRAAERAAVAAELARAEEELHALQARLDALDPEALEHRRARAAAAEQATAELVRLAARARDLAERRASLAARRADAEARRAEADAALDEVARERVPLDAALADARRTLELSEAANDEAAARLRALLVDDEPCPVCGSLDHSQAPAETALDALVRDRRARVATLTDAMKALDVRERQARTARDVGEETLTACTEEARRLARETAALHEAWAEARAGLCDAPPETDSEAVDAGALADRAEAARGAAEAAARDQEEAAKLRAEGDRKRARRDHLRLALDEVKDILSSLEQDHARFSAEAEVARAEAGRARKALEDADAALDGPLSVLPGWRDDARTDAPGLIRRCRTLGAEWHERRAAREAAAAEIARLDAAEAAAEAEARGCRAAADEAARRQAEADQTQAELGAERAALLDGEPTAAVRDRLTADRRAAQEALTAAQAARQEAAGALAAAVSTVEALAARMAETATARAEAESARDAALTAAGTTLEEARTALAVSDDDLAALEQRLQALDEAVATTAAVLADRRAALEAHRATPAPQDDAASLAARAAEVAGACERAREQAAAARARLAHDADQRARGAEIAAAMAAQREVTDLWATMNDLIGSANGDRFRRFAQSLTLDRLLGLANSHLADLAPRYALQRTPGGELDLQVIDREMGDEVRGVGSLSGGERFLVSLALALGLASMSGERTLVESLFIDEGFGALDATSLDIALSALEALQATGRKVGVISHVQAMVDRISVQVRVGKAGGGRSTVAVTAA